MIVDFGARFNHSKRSLAKALAIFGRVITKGKDLQIDPPESEVLQKLCVQVNFTNSTTMIESEIMDGVIQTTLEDIMQKALNGELKA